MTEEIMNTLVFGAASVGVLFFIIWIAHIFLKNAGIVDVGWGIGFIILSAVYVIQGEGFTLRNTLYFLMVTLWGLRIALFLLKRIAGEGHEDKRYQKMRNSWGRHLALKFLFFFEFQALLQMILAVPFLIVSVNKTPGVSFWEIGGLIVFAFALIGETISDEQLQNFRQNPLHAGKTCNVGLWRYSRHPNYFFEWLIWVGFFIYALGSPYGWASVISPVLMYYLMVYVSGVPLAEEQALKSRGDDYRKYQAQTSVFFPLPQKNRGA
jgi:steroid 5-alpha reductase family enzyme